MDQETTDLLRQNGHLLAAYGAWLARSRGGRVETWNDVLMCDGGFASPQRNMVVPTRPLNPQQVRGLRAEIDDFYGPGHRWVLWGSYGDDLHGRGFVPLGEECLLMTRAEGPLPPSLQPYAGLLIEECGTDDAVRAFEDIRERANGRHSDVASGGFLDGRALGNGYRMWLGFLDGKPVAAAASFRVHGENLIKNVATLPEVCGLGIGTVMSARAVGAGGRCFLDSSNPPAIHLYRKLGFGEFGRLRTWGPGQ